jgi:hypothetical protein
VPYGKLTHTQEQVLSKHVRGKIVYDLGAGDLSLSRRVLELGASHVRCIDKEAKSKKKLPRCMSYEQTYFHQWQSGFPLDVAFCSWPANYETNVLPLLLRAQTIIYLGKNTDGTACGTVSLFEHSITRELLDYSPHHLNSLIVLGQKLQEPRRPVGEELAGLRMVEYTYYTFGEAEHYSGCPHWEHEQKVKALHGVESGS